MDDPRFLRILMPYAAERVDRLRENGRRLVHYTSAESAYNIIRTRTLWLRLTSCMNDYSEVVHGERSLAAAMRSEAGQRFLAALNAIDGDAGTRLEKLYSGWLDTIFGQTFIASLSEESDKEQALGRLSMWRAYGGNGGIALFFNQLFFLEPHPAINAWCSPVAYMGGREVEAELERVAQNVEERRREFASLSAAQIDRLTFSMMRFATICIKHYGFDEEREWRIVHTVGLDRGPLHKSVEVVGGLPQAVVKIPLEGPEGSGVSFDQVLETIVIGPTDYQHSINEALILTLEEAGVRNARDRIVGSGIPLR